MTMGKLRTALVAGMVLFIPLFWTVSITWAQGKSDDRGVRVTSTTPSFQEWGNYYALIIGINSYKEWPALQTAANDARALGEILTTQYGFLKKNVILRLDEEATRSQITNDLREVAGRLSSTDNFLVYFAGHGQIDDLTGEGYWIPVKGKLKDTSTWLAHNTVKSILSSDKVKAKNIVVIADSCYAGALLRGGPSLLSLADGRYEERLKELSRKRSRQVVTSGGKEPVADGGRDGHSLFAYYFLKGLRENTMVVVDLENLFHSKVWKPVTEIGGQRPNVGRLKTPMDEDGQFVLFQTTTIAISQKADKAFLDDEERKLEEERKKLEEERASIATLRQQIEERRKIEEERKRLEDEQRRLEEERKEKSREDALKVKSGTVRPWLGISAQDLTPEMIQLFQVKEKEGALVGQVYPGTGAEKTGLKPGDIIKSVDDKVVRNVNELVKEVQRKKVGQKVKLNIIRDVKVMIVEMTLTSMSGEVQKVYEAEEKLGVRVQELTPQLFARYQISGVKKGLVITGKEDGSLADEIGLQEGDVILEVNRKKIETKNNFENAVMDINLEKGILFLLNRKGSSFYLTFKK